MTDDKGKWITVNGTHIFIKDGQTIEEALQELSVEELKKVAIVKPNVRSGTIRLPRKEYGAVCHVIYTKYADKIPPKGNLLYKNHFYAYTYNRRYEQILFTERIEIVGNEELIDVFLRIYK